TLARLRAYLQENPGVSMAAPLLRDGQGRVQASFRQQPTIATFLHRHWLLRWTGLSRRAHRRYRRPEGARSRHPLSDLPQGLSVEVLMGAAMFMDGSRFLAMGGWDEDFHFGGEDLEICLRARRLGPLMYLPQVEITHFGRASTRLNVAFASTKIAIGFVQY